MQNNEDFEQQLYQYRYLTEQREMFTRQLEILRASLGNLQNTKLTAENMRDLKEGEEILVPIGGMMNVKAKIMNPENFLLYVSDDLVIEKDLDGSIEFLDALIEQHKEQIDKIQTHLQNLNLNIQAFSSELQKRMPQQQ